MKKVLVISILMLAGVVLSGCGNSTTVSNSTATNTTYAVSKSIWKSEDGGTTWTAKDKSKDKLSVSDLDVLNIIVNPYADRSIIAGLKFGGYIKSEDGADTWQKTIFVSDRVYGLSFDPSSPNVIYASGVWKGRGKLFKSEDGGASWKEIFTASSDGPFISALAIDNKNPRIIFAATSDNQAMKSENAGESWKNIYQTKSPIVKISLDKENDSLVYAATLNGQILRSGDGGNAFEDIGKNLSGERTFSAIQEYNFLETDPLNAGWVYLAGKGGITRSKDGGNVWEKITTLNDPGKYPVTSLAINPKNSQELTYGAGQAIYKSVDGGIHWTTSQFNTTKFISVIKYDPANPQIIYVGFKKQ
jgi:photosystem II stability/assembly factor-like uncharacterized protein